LHGFHVLFRNSTEWESRGWGNAIEIRPLLLPLGGGEFTPSTLDMVTFTLAAVFPSESWGTFTTKAFRGVSYLTSSIVKTWAAAAGILLRRE